MRTSLLELMVFSVFCTIIFHQNTEAYQNRITHPFINNKAVEKSNLDDVLKLSLGFIKGKGEKIGEKKYGNGFVMVVERKMNRIGVAQNISMTR
jgi:thiamine kinase-like enzyme